MEDQLKDVMARAVVPAEVSKSSLKISQAMHLLIFLVVMVQFMAVGEAQVVDSFRIYCKASTRPTLNSKV